MGKPLDPTSGRARIRDANKATALIAAHDLFREHSYETVSVRMIAKRAHCSTGALFGYWPDKPAMFKAAMGREPIDDAKGVGYLAALFQIRRSVQHAPETEVIAEIEAVLARCRLDDPSV